jgi:hypothetical protein
VREYHETPAFERAMTKRRVRVEPLFAEAKQWHHLNKFRLRGRKNVNMEGLLIAAGQNLKRLLQATGWGKRQMPGGAAAVLSHGLNTQFAQQRAITLRDGPTNRSTSSPNRRVPGGTSFINRLFPYGPLPQDAVQGPSEVDVWIRCEMVLVRQVSVTPWDRDCPRKSATVYR